MKMPASYFRLRLLPILVLSGACLYSTVISQKYLSASYKNGSVPSEALYLPQRETIKLLSFGYQSVIANYLWFKTINYFGKHYTGDQNYQWLFHMCSLVATLSPNSLHVYEFGSTILSWEAAQAPLAQKLLSQGIQENPESWKLRYLRGFNYYYFLNDAESAKQDFIASAKLPGAHPITARLAAKTLAKQNDPKQAIEFLSDTLKGTSDPAVRRVLIERLRELHYEDDLQTLERALATFRQRSNRWPSALDEILPFLDRSVSNTDPFGGEYKISPNGEAIISSSHHKRLGAKR